MISLLPTRLHWIKDDGKDDPKDLCAHSPVRLEINGDTLVAPEDGDATVSAAALYLLRTLEADHTKLNPVGDQLFPCCGHGMFDTGDADVVISGCPNGSEVFVERLGDITRLTTPAGVSYEVPNDEWRGAVHDFSDAVLDFYKQSASKTPHDDEQSAGFAKMMCEWKRRRGGP
ncbi:hypothetical protein OAG71_04090 [bacterium]|nr:hypothetical protein [bacterium]